mmetsp:Transcript_4690/g.9198  ORF Transcript_4690/g.9198 Transcript_4690/m.9198 type:complete len:171 (-) Transcript_4690:77-589(-)
MIQGRLILYCGHGGAENCFPRSEIDKLIFDKANSSNQLCKSTIVLMGCSSGKISSSGDSLFPFYEPDGIATDYLCAGSPCVIANLWDVTDRDIDRFFLDFLERSCSQFDEQDKCTASVDSCSNNHSRSNFSDLSFAHCVSRARDACKLRYLVGSAPVCYGVPVKPLRRHK